MKRWTVVEIQILNLSMEFGIVLIVVYGPQIIQGWIEYNPRNVIPYKTV